MGGVEPPLLAQHAPQACVSTNFTTSACLIYFGISVGSVDSVEVAGAVEPVGISIGVVEPSAAGAITDVGIIDSPMAPSGCATNHASINEFEKNTTAKPVVNLVKKLPEPLEPNTVPDAPPPNAAPASAPLPCWINTRPIIPSATKI